MKWDLLRDAAKHGRTEEALVRIMVPLTEATAGSAAELAERVKRADDIATKVAHELLPQVGRVLPRWDESKRIASRSSVLAAEKTEDRGPT